MARRRQQRSDIRTDIERVFDWDEFVAFGTQPSAWAKDTAAIKMGPRAEARPFNGNCTLDDAVRMARFGWAEGRENLSHAIAVARPERITAASVTRDVAGDYPLIPAAVAGDPMNMMTRRRSHVAATPVVRIDYNGTVHGGIDAKCIVNRGAALLSIVDAMESRGYSCELRIIFKVRGDDQRLRVAITYKQAGEPLDIDRAAFALIHPATLRRFFLGCIEQFPKFEANFSPRNGRGYGVPDPTPWDDDPASVFVDGATDDDYSPENARRRMGRIFSDYLED